MATSYTLKVSGSGQFPLDMLRYDACWPAGQDDVALIAETLDMQSRHDAIRRRRASGEGHATITLHSHQAPTPARWSSFLWGCQVEVRR